MKVDMHVEKNQVVIKMFSLLGIDLLSFGPYSN